MTTRASRPFAWLDSTEFVKPRSTLPHACGRVGDQDADARFGRAGGTNGLSCASSRYARTGGAPGRGVHLPGSRRHRSNVEVERKALGDFSPAAHGRRREADVTIPRVTSPARVAC